MLEVLDRAPVHSIDDAITLMRAIDESLPDRDGVKWFNRLYLRVTVSVRSAVGSATFNDPAFLTELDVVFANLYFSALAAASTDIGAAPSAWRPLLQARNTPGIARIQFALAGMNAHINRDLPAGIAQSFLALGGDPITDDLREQDFDSVNETLERVEQEVKTEFTVGVVGAVDRLGGPVDDAVAMWKVRAARSAAWTNAQVLWGLRGLPRLRDRFFARLDGLVGMTGRGLLVGVIQPPSARRRGPRKNSGLRAQIVIAGARGRRTLSLDDPLQCYPSSMHCVRTRGSRRCRGGLEFQRRSYLRMTALTVFVCVQIVMSGAARQASRPQNGDESVVLVGAGDIANCDMLGGARATAALLDKIEGTVFTLGDHAYPDGSAKQLKECYEPTWGRHKARTRPTPGNHDLATDRGRPYYEYFGENAGPIGRGYYSYDLGAWHIISLNGTAVVDARSPQATWLRQDLASHPTDCVLAYWHMPLFSSGPHGGSPEMNDVWKILYEAGADVVVNSHDHLYERFAPLNQKGEPDSERGVRLFLVGTGGAGVYKLKKIARHSEVHNNTTYGVLKFTLSPGHYAWEFIPMAGQTFTDSGSAVCSPAR